MSLCIFIMLLVGRVVGSSKTWSTCVVTQFGARGDGKTLNTEAIQYALNVCYRVVIPAGTFLTGALNITSDTTLEIEPKGVLLGSVRPEDYPVINWLPSYPTGRDIPGPRYQPLIFAYRATNFKINGTGAINGNGPTWWLRFSDKTLKYGRPGLIETFESQNIQISSVSLVNSAFWTVHLFSSDSIEIAHIKILAPADSENTDGIDPDSATNVWIHDCYISNGDDCVAVKSGYNEPGIKYNKPSANITAERLECHYGHGLSIGSEMSGGVYNVTFKNIKMFQSTHGPHLKTAIGRGGFIRNVTYAFIEVSDLQEVITIITDYDSDGENALPDISNCSFYGITGTGDKAGTLGCLKQSPCESMNFDSIKLNTTKGFECQYLYGRQNHVQPKLCVF